MLLLDSALLDFVLLELLEIVGQAHLLPHPDTPFGRVILEGLDGVAVVGREFVVEVVVPFTESYKSRDDVVARRVPVVERLVTKPMSERVDTECGLLDEEDAQDACIDEATVPVTPAQPCHGHGEYETHEEDDLEVVLVLPYDDWVFVQVADVSTADSLWVLPHQHPAKVAVEQSFPHGVGVFVSVGVAVMCAVIAGPWIFGQLPGA